MTYRVAGWIPSLFLCLAALSAAGENPEVFRKQWEPDGSVKKVYDTPLGAVYEFSSGPLHKCLPYADTSDGQRHDFKCSCPKCRNRDTAAVKGSLQSASWAAAKGTSGSWRWNSTPAVFRP